MATKKKRKVVRKKKKKSSSGAGWRNSPITAGVAIVIIILSFYITFGPSGASKFKMDYVCTGCREEVRQPIIRETPPYACPSCDKKALWNAMHCIECGKTTAVFPPLAEYGCTECGHVAEERLPGQPPHDCPKCAAEKTYHETLLCLTCDASFVPNPDEELACPECQGFDNVPTIEPFQECEHCGSEDMIPITPHAVIRMEMGKKLTPAQEKEVEAWKLRQQGK